MRDDLSNSSQFEFSHPSQHQSSQPSVLSSGSFEQQHRSKQNNFLQLYDDSQGSKKVHGMRQGSANNSSSQHSHNESSSANNEFSQVAQKHMMVSRMSAIEQGIQAANDCAQGNTRQLSSLQEKISNLEKQLEEKSKYQEELILSAIQKCTYKKNLLFNKN